MLYFVAAFTRGCLQYRIAGIVHVAETASTMWVSRLRVGCACCDALCRVSVLRHTTASLVPCGSQTSRLWQRQACGVVVAGF
jgi:hypothetical protein